MGLGLFYMLYLSFWPMECEASDPEVLKPRVPAEQMEEVRTWTNPFPSTPNNIKKGKVLFHGKAFCVTCHGKDGKGLKTYLKTTLKPTKHQYINHKKPTKY